DVIYDKRWDGAEATNGCATVGDKTTIEAEVDNLVSDTVDELPAPKTTTLPCGRAFVTAWGGSGSGDGEFVLPHGIAVDGSGNVFVLDVENSGAQKFTNRGAFVTGGGPWPLPPGIAVDGSGPVFVADQIPPVFTPAAGFLLEVFSND